MRKGMIEIMRSLFFQPDLPDASALQEVHFDAALAWVLKARREGGGGISKGYDLLRRKWYPAYPETTGYTIPSLLNAARARSRPELARLALDLAQFLLEAASPEGGVVHWERKSEKPVVFDTGQVIFGWLAAYDHSANPAFLQAAQRAGDWLEAIQDASGAWARNQHLDVVKTIDTRVAWALLELERRSPAAPYRAAARRSLEWALANQQPDGWFAQCAFLPDEDPFTHTLAYTAEGFMECGLLLREDRYLQAARKTAAALLARQRPNGSLPATFARAWKPTSRSSCLTGNCQAARLWLQCYELDPQPAYLEGAIRAIRFVAATQTLDPRSANRYGGIAGSSPLVGRYERLKYPNWAAKFFIDALLTLESVQRQGATALTFKG